MQRGAPERHDEHFMLEVTNTGRRSAQITSIVWRDGIARFGVNRLRFGTQFVMLPPQNPLSASVPKTLADGEQAHYFMPWEEFERTNAALLSRFGGRFGGARARLFRMGVTTSAGGIHDAAIEKPLAERFVKHAREARP